MSSDTSIDLGEGLLRLFNYNEKNKIDIFRKKFKNKNTVVVGCNCDPNSAKIICNSKNLDWICLDMEHGLINLSSISKILDAVQLSNKIVLARISLSDIKNIPKILDLGIDGVIIANSKTENDILNIYRLSNYPTW